MVAPSGRLRAVTFDCWSTLIYERDPARGFERRLCGFLELLRAGGLAPRPSQAQLALRHAWLRHGERWMAGEHCGAAAVARWALEHFDAARPEAIEKLTALLEGAHEDDAVAVVEGAAETLSELAARRVRLALVCDTGLTPGRQVRGLLARAGLLDALEVLVFSDEVGVPKPDARAFRAALGPLGVAPRDAAHVGDMRRTDIAGARALGMGTIRIRAHHDDRSDLPEADHVVRSHAELRRLLAC